MNSPVFSLPPEWKEVEKEKTVGPAETEAEPAKDQIEIMALFRGKLQEVLSNRLMETAEILLGGGNYRDVARHFKISRDRANGRVTYLRKMVEQKVILPAGFKRTNRYGETVARAASRGTVESVTFMGRKYTTDEWVKHYQPRRQIIDHVLLDGDFLLLSRQVTPREYQVLMKHGKYSRLLKKHQGRFYISTTDLKEFRAFRKQNPRDLKSPDGYEKLTDLAQSQREYLKLRQAVAERKLKVLKKGRWLFVKPADVKEFLNLHPLRK